MNSTAHDYTARLAGALERQGSSMTVESLLEVLREASESTSEPLTAGERSFLLESTDLTEENLTPQARAASRTQVAHDRAQAESTAHFAALTTAEVAGLLGRKEASIRRSKLTGDLHALPTSIGRASRFPAWQFAGSRVVPHLRETIPAFPRYTHPLSIERFMTTAHEALDDRSPAQWLLEGGSAAAVTSLIDELGYE
ncbi:MAG: hypothetical protein ACTHZ5_00285 [Micrococcaceae bacterium]